MSAPPDSGIYVHGLGAVSPAGWGIAALLDAVRAGQPLPPVRVERPGWTGRPLQALRVPAPVPRPPFLGHARVRRTSPIAHHLVASALEAIGPDGALAAKGGVRLGFVVCVMSGCVNYSRRFYDETLRDPSTASPLVFPETVFNAPSSHLAAMLGCTGINYTLVGDSGTFVQGLALGADWLLSGIVDACVVVGAEEGDWLTADALRLFCRNATPSEGAGAIYLKRDPARVRLEAITDPHLFTMRQSRAAAARRVRAELPEPQGTVLCDGLQGVPRMDAAEAAAWSDWAGGRLSVKRVMGESFTAAAAWQCVAAIDALRGGWKCVNVPVIGANHHAIGVRWGLS